MDQTTSSLVLSMTPTPRVRRAHDDRELWEALSSSVARTTRRNPAALVSRRSAGRSIERSQLSRSELRLVATVAGIVAGLFGLAAAHATTPPVGRSGQGTALGRDMSALVLVGSRPLPRDESSSQLPAVEDKK